MRACASAGNAVDPLSSLILDLPVVTAAHDAVLPVPLRAASSRR
jgi:hypothetical protein